MKPRAFNLLAATSLLLCLAMAALWPLSYLSYSVFVYRGQIFFSLAKGEDANIATFAGNLDDPARVLSSLRSYGSTHLQRLDFEFCTGQYHNDLAGNPWTSFWLAGVPIWFVIVVFTVAPALWLLRSGRKRANRLAKRCVQCGYDLRATPDRCPECGLEPETPPSNQKAGARDMMRW